MIIVFLGRFSGLLGMAEDGSALYIHGWWDGVWVRWIMALEDDLGLRGLISSYGLNE